MNPAYAALYKTLYREHWWWQARERILLDVLRRVAPVAPARILDVGCGDGLFFSRLKEFGTPEGIEAEPGLVSEEGQRQGTIHVGCIEDFAGRLRPFDMLVCLDVIEHVRDDRSFLRCAAQLLRPGGVAVVTVPAFARLWTSHDDYNHHFRRYTKTMLTGAAVESGLRVVETHYFFQWLAAAKCLVRAKEQVCGASARLPQVPGAAANRFLAGISRAEWKLQRFLRLPFGSSLLAVLGKD